MSVPDLGSAAAALDLARTAVDGAVRRLASSGALDDHQVVAYDVAHAAAAVQGAAQLLADYAPRGEDEAALSVAFAADAVHDVMSRILGREDQWGLEAPDALDAALPFVRQGRDPAFLAGLARVPGDRHLDEDFQLVQETFRRFAEDRIAPVAEHVHRTNADIPEEVISGLAEIGGFGLSVPEEYGGYATGGESDYLGMEIGRAHV